MYSFLRNWSTLLYKLSNNKKADKTMADKTFLRVKKMVLDRRIQTFQLCGRSAQPKIKKLIEKENIPD